MSDEILLSVVMPAYKEADNLRELLPPLRETVTRLVGDASAGEILVVDTQTPMDDTPAVCRAAGVRCLPRHPDNLYGSAIRTGVAASGGRFVVVMDADGSHNPGFLPELWAHREEADVVIASRYVPGGATQNPWLQVAMSKVLNSTFKFFAGMPVRDVSNSFRLYRGERLRSLELKGNHFDILEEILGQLLWCQPDRPARMIEVPFCFEKRRHGSSKRSLLVFSWRFLLALFRMRALRKNIAGR